MQRNKSDIAIESLGQAELVALAKQQAAALAAAEERLAVLQSEYQHLVDVVRRARSRKFGVKGESLDNFQLGLFNEAEAGALECAQEPVPSGNDDAERGKRKRAEGPRRAMDTSKMKRRDDVHHMLHDADCQCPNCQSAMDELRTETREVIYFVPGHFEVERHIRHVYICKPCAEANAADGVTPVAIVKAPTADLPIEKSFASASLVAHVIAEKYVSAKPLNRVSRDLHLLDPNVGISRQVMAGWVIAVHDRWLRHIQGHMRKKLMEGDFLHCDETTVQVLKEKGRDAVKTSYMWVLAAPACSDAQIRIFNYKPGRSGDMANDLLDGWSGTVMSDCYSVYFSLTGVDNLACLVHIRREFYKIIQGYEDTVLVGAKSLAYAACKRIDDMFKADKALTADAGGDLGKRKELRLERLKPKIDEFELWLAANVVKAVPGSELRRAFNNAIRHWRDVRHVLDDGRFPLDNNLAERAIRPFAVGRRNWLFCDTEAGAEASACMYSIVSTALANGVRPEPYFEWLLTEMPKGIDLEDPEALEGLMPWSPELPRELLLDDGEPRCLPDDSDVDIDPKAMEAAIA